MNSFSTLFRLKPRLQNSLAPNRFQVDALARIIHGGFNDQPKGASQMALTLCFREPVGASPGPEFAGEVA